MPPNAETASLLVALKHLEEALAAFENAPIMPENPELARRLHSAIERLRNARSSARDPNDGALAQADAAVQNAAELLMSELRALLPTA